MKTDDRVRVTSNDSTNGRIGTVVRANSAHDISVRLDGQSADHNTPMVFAADELTVIGSYVVRLRLDARASTEPERYLSMPGGSITTTFSKAHRFPTLEDARREADRYPAWREVVEVSVKRMIIRPVYGLKKVAA